jgi:hypothetical protein
MKTELDLKVNNADDIIFDGIDLVTETDIFSSSMKNAQRRVSARQTDFIIRPEIAAGIESFLQSNINDFLLSDLESTIRFCMTQYGLFENKDFKVKFDTTNAGKLGVIILFSPNVLSSSEETSFSVFVDIQNQRSYS